MSVNRADASVMSIVDKVQKSFHPKLLEARIALIFNESKPFVKGRFNWGKTSKFSSVNKLFHPNNEKYDFVINLCQDGWYSILNDAQREAWVDLHLCSCKPQFMPIIEEKNGKRKPVKDEYGRIQYSDEIKYNDDGSPKWSVLPLDLNVFTENAEHYGCWCQDLLDFRSVIRDIDRRNDNMKMSAS